jgi:hypothetical protein
LILQIQIYDSSLSFRAFELIIASDMIVQTNITVLMG